MEFFTLIENNLTFAAIGAIFVATLPFAFKNGLIHYKERRQRIQTAGVSITAAFQPELTAISQGNNDCGNTLDTAAFLRHEAAIMAHSKNLGLIKRRRLHKAWKELAYHSEKKYIPFYDTYADCGSLDKRAELKPLAISRIQNLISSVS